ncbi:Cysteine dioxygenase type I [Friedmanniella luteola]|uniref:Cysteine dioxygenase type I n=1 Tax=Friedmanniella luteola TaxID=546871 RepID=A0A1H1LTZ2_9ACTN|nr:cysteine dioxygenase family protein [Friedmanniella luteola]SDR77820.1 Cysteine dioxygenase type I [Friedmanniella luteola]
MSITARPQPTLPSARLRRPVPAQIARRIADTPALWRPLVRFDAHSRFATRLPATADDHEVWLLTWLPGQGTAWHDHGGSAGAFATVQGVLTEQHATPARDDEPARVVPGARRLVAGGVRPFGPRHVHQVVNADALPAVSVHVYAPSLTEMTEYTRHGSLLHSSGSQLAGVNW